MPATAKLLVCVFMLSLLQAVCSASDNQTSAAQGSGPTKTVLVLGAGGLVGQALVAHLERSGHRLIVSRNRVDHDLRQRASLGAFDNQHIDFCFFLAYENGGAKFINMPEHDSAITTYNALIENNVIDYLGNRGIPF
eukprot:2472703-Rhodomonas_salina.1